MITVTISGKSWDAIVDQAADILMHGAKTFGTIDELFEDLDEPTKAPRKDDLPSSDLIPPATPLKSSQREIRAYVEEYLRDGCRPDQIRSLLASEWNIHITGNQLGGYVSSILQKARNSPVTELSPPEPTIAHKPTKEPEATIWDMWKKNCLNVEIQQFLDRQQHIYMSVEDIQRIIEGFA